MPASSLIAVLFRLEVRVYTVDAFLLVVNGKPHGIVRFFSITKVGSTSLMGNLTFES